MKQLRKCMDCGHLFPMNACYQAERETFVKNALTGDIATKSVRGHICAVCNKNNGFITNAKKTEKAEKCLQAKLNQEIHGKEK